MKHRLLMRAASAATIARGLGLLALLALALVLPAAERRAAPPRAGEPVNDHTLFHFLDAEGRKMLRSGRTATNLQARLDRKSCRLSLVSPPLQKLTPAEVAARAEPAVVVLGRFYQCGQCARVHLGTASGFTITESGALVTSLHVFKNPRTLGLVALTRDGRLCAVRDVLAADPVNDVAILQLDGTAFTPLPLSTNAPVGSTVLVLSHPENHFYMLTAGLVSRHTLRDQRRGPVPEMTITADFAQGSSGAPVLNEAGAVVGVVNNTQSLYTDPPAGRDREPVPDFQMTVKNCTPAAAVLRLIAPP